MAHCYQCGRHLASDIPFHRRRVKTNEYFTRRYPGQRIKALHINYGQRIVCAWCAKRIDRERRLEELLDWVKILLGVVLIIILLTLWR